MKRNKPIHLYIVNNNLDMEKIMLEYTPYIQAIIINRSVNLSLSEEDIEEIIIDVFLALWNNRKILDINKEMSAYLAGITKNLIHKKIRNQSNITYIEDYREDLIKSETVEIQIEKLENNKMIIEELNKMKQEDKEIFILYYYNSKSIKEISNILYISELKVKSRLFRIRKKLKRALEKRGYSYNG